MIKNFLLTIPQVEGKTMKSSAVIDSTVAQVFQVYTSNAPIVEDVKELNKLPINRACIIKVVRLEIRR